jgi:hypothetical protein
METEIETCITHDQEKYVASYIRNRKPGDSPLKFHTEESLVAWEKFFESYEKSRAGLKQK